MTLSGLLTYKNPLSLSYTRLFVMFMIAIRAGDRDRCVFLGLWGQIKNAWDCEKHKVVFKETHNHYPQIKHALCVSEGKMCVELLYKSKWSTKSCQTKQKEKESRKRVTGRKRDGIEKERKNRWGAVKINPFLPRTTAYSFKNSNDAHWESTKPRLERRLYTHTWCLYSASLCC